MNFEVKRSPARVCWWVLLNGVLLGTADTRYEAIILKSSYEKRYA